MRKAMRRPEGRWMINMSESVKISYSSLESASREAQQTAQALGAYRESVSSAVCETLQNVSGEDSSGYVSLALTAAGQKRKELLIRKQKYQSLARQLSRFSDQARQTDRNLARRIRVTGASFTGSRSLVQGVWDRAYETFCILLPGRFSVTKLIGDGIRWVDTERSAMAEDLKDWFRYKEGRYWGAMAKSVVTPVASAAGAAGAIGAVSFAGPAVLIVTGAGALSAGILAVISAGNSGFAMAGNVQALASSCEGELGLSRFQGSVKGFSDYVQTHDLGDEETNAGFAAAAGTIETVKSGAGALNVVLGAVSLGAHTSSVTGKVDGYSFGNIKENILKSFGFKPVPASSGENARPVISAEAGGSNQVEYRFSPSGLLKSRTGARYHRYLQSYLGLGKTDPFFYEASPAIPPAQKFSSLNGLEKSAKMILDAGYMIKSTMGKLEDMRKVSQALLYGEDVFSSDSTMDAWLSVLSFLKPVGSLKKWVIAPMRLIAGSP